MKIRTALTAPGATALALLLFFGCGDDDDPTDPGGTGDTTAPAAVSDLAVTSVAGTVVNLAWTAPGDDGSTGLATSYDLRVSNTTLTEANWSAGTRITMGVPSPASAGVAQTAAVDVAGKADRYLAVRAVDEADNMAALSNVVSASVDLGFEVKQLTTEGPNVHPCVNDGVVCWVGWHDGADEIFVANVRVAYPSPDKITDNGAEKAHPSNHGSVKIVWQGREDGVHDWEIFSYHHLSIPRYSAHTDDEIDDMHPVLAGGGDYAWLKGPTNFQAVHYRDELTHSSRIISDDCCPTPDYGHYPPAADDGEVVWRAYHQDGPGEHAVYLWNGVLTNITAAIAPVLPLEFSIHDGELAYEDGIGTNMVMYWDGATAHTVAEGYDPCLYDGTIAFEDWDGQDWEIYWWDGSEVHQITDNDYNDTQVSQHDGVVAWVGRPAGSTDHIFYAIVEDE